MNRGIICSVFLHGILLLMLIFGLPSLFDKKILDDTVVTVEVLPISAVSNVKPVKHQPVPPKPEPPKPEPVKKAEPPQPKPEPKAEPKPEPKVEPVKMEDAIPLKPTVKPKPPKKEEPKKPEPKPAPKAEKKPEPKKDKPKEKDPFESLEKDLQKKAEEKQKQEAFDSLEESLTKKTTKTYDPSVPLSISETDAIRQQFYSCWTPPVGARDLENMSAVVHITIEKDGTVSNVALVPNAQYNGDSFYQVFAESAVRAVHKCSPLKVMPSPDKFSSWHEMELTFNPKDMF